MSKEIFRKFGWSSALDTTLISQQDQMKLFIVLQRKLGPTIWELDPAYPKNAESAVGAFKSDIKGSSWRFPLHIL